jgi:ketosteroid isomerase-like protein
VWTQQAQLTSSEGATNENFGFSVSISGDTAVVGALWDADQGEASGSAYVFVRSVDGEWSQQAKLTVPEGGDFHYLGGSVSIDGDTAVIGAPGAASSSGLAYVFVRSVDGEWSRQATLAQSISAGNDQFGSTVSVNGDTAVVGAYRSANADVSRGSAYVFVRSDSVWSEQAKLTDSDGSSTDYFAESVSVSGETLVVSASRDHSVHVFVRAEGAWTLQAKLTADDGFRTDRFGKSVSVNGNIVVVGASGDSDAGIASGSAYVFVRSNEVWTQQEKLTASDASGSANFGESVSVSGDTVAIGAPRDSVSADYAGSAYVYSCV